MYIVSIIWVFFLEGPSVYGWPPGEYNQLPFTAATQTHGEAANQRIHTLSKREVFFFSCNDIDKRELEDYPAKMYFALFCVSPSSQDHSSLSLGLAELRVNNHQNKKTQSKLRTRLNDKGPG